MWQPKPGDTTPEQILASFDSTLIEHGHPLDVVYKPPLTFLWAGPLICVMFVLYGLWLSYKRDSNHTRDKLTIRYRYFNRGPMTLLLPAIILVLLSHYWVGSEVSVYTTQFDWWFAAAIIVSLTILATLSVLNLPRWVWIYTVISLGMLMLVTYRLSTLVHPLYPIILLVQYDLIWWFYSKFKKSSNLHIAASFDTGFN